MIQAQRGWQCQRNWWCQHDESGRQRNEGDNADEVVNATMECGYSYLRLLLYTNWQHINVCKHLIMSNMEVGSSLRWLSASTMIKMHHFYSTSDHVTQNLCQVGWVWLCKAAIICLWTAYQCTQTLCMCLIWRWEAASGGCQHQPWCSDIILTPQVTQNPEIWAK